MSKALNWVTDVVHNIVPRPAKHLFKTVVPGVDRWIYGTIQRFSSSAPVEVAIRGGPLKGRRFCCSLRTERDYWIGNHEPLVAYLLGQLLSDGGVFYDVGVHKGYFSLIAARSLGPNGLVIGFEPNPHNLKAAQSNVDLNPDLAPRIRIEHLAVSDGDGSVEFAGEPGSAMGKIWEGGAGVHVLQELFAVHSICLDDFIRAGNPTPDLIKMDIEGGEVKALRGLATALRNGAVLIVEVHNEDAFATLCDVVAEPSYRCNTLDDGKPLSALNGFRGREQFLVYPRGHLDLEAALSRPGGLVGSVRL